MHILDILFIYLNINSAYINIHQYSACSFTILYIFSTVAICSSRSESFATALPVFAALSLTTGFALSYAHPRFYRFYAGGARLFAVSLAFALGKKKARRYCALLHWGNKITVQCKQPFCCRNKTSRRFCRFSLGKRKLLRVSMAFALGATRDLRVVTTTLRVVAGIICF